MQTIIVIIHEDRIEMKSRRGSKLDSHGPFNVALEVSVSWRRGQERSLLFSDLRRFSSVELRISV